MASESSISLTPSLAPLDPDLALNISRVARLNEDFVKNRYMPDSGTLCARLDELGRIGAVRWKG